MIRYTYIFIIGLLLCAPTVEAQEQKSYRQRAEQLYLAGEYMRAADIYERLADVKKPRVSDIERLGECYLYISEFTTAENWFARAYRMEGHDPNTVLNYAEVLRQNMRYPEAKEVLEKYRSAYGEEEQVALQIAGSDSSILWLPEPTLHRIQNLKDINTDLSEFGFFPTSDGAVFAGEPKIHVEAKKSGMTGKGYLKIFSAERQGNGYDRQGVRDERFNDARYHVGPVITDQAEQTMFVTRTYPKEENTERYKEEGYRFRKHNLELIIYKLNADGDWEGEGFAYNNVEEYSLGHAALSEDENRLYFASDMPGGYGGVDIWYSERQDDGSWGEPVNAGEEINTSGDDMFPSVYKNQLFYSTDGKPGMGGLDIFEAEIKENGFGTPVNLKYPVNSPGDDFCFVISENNDEVLKGFLSSNRTGGAGGDDIYSFLYEKPKIIITLEGVAIHKETRDPLPASRITLYSPEGNIIARKAADENGGVRFSLDKGTDYIVRGEHEGFHADSSFIASVFPQADTILSVVLELEPMFKVGDKIVLENIYYDFDKDNIRPDAAEILDELIVTLRDNPTLKIELSSHTDSRGSHAYNEDLSQRRAQSAVDYLVSRGIARDRLVAKGYGERRLTNHCSDGVPCSIAEHQANRRTEIEVLSTDYKE